MNKTQLLALASELSQSISSQKDLADFQKELKKLTIEAALKGELDDHLGYEKNKTSSAKNYRNGTSSKTVITEDGELMLDIPRDRDASFEPQLIKKHETRFTSMNDKVLTLYAKGMTCRDIVATIKEMYDVDVSAELISRVTDRVIDEVLEWQTRPLEPIYPIVYLDCIVVKIREGKRVINKAIYLALGVDLDGHKALLGMWISENEGAKFWLTVLTELKNRGVEDILIVCVDGLKGFPDAIRTVFPEAQVQLCIVHMVRNSLRYVSWKDYKAVTVDLKLIYRSITEEEAQSELNKFEEKWQEKYPQIAKSWRANWPDLITFFNYPDDIRKAIYTTNAIESLNSVVRKATKLRKIFPTDDSARKVIYLAVVQASKKWTMPIRNWRPALNRFIIEFEDRIVKYLER